MIHIDTGFLIRGLVRSSKEDQKLRLWLRGGEELAMSAVAWAEFLCGPLEDTHIDLAMRVILSRVPLGDTAAQLAAMLFNATGRRRGSLADCMIGATAIVADAALATTNGKDFERFEAHGLRLA